MKKNIFSGVLSFSEAEQYIRKFQKKIFVIKYGGNALTNNYLANNFAKDIVFNKKTRHKCSYSSWWRSSNH